MLASVEVDNVSVLMELDTGATLTVMNYATFLCLHGLKLQHPLQFPVRLNCIHIRVRRLWLEGEAEVAVKYRDQTAQVTLIVMEGQGPSLLGRDWLQYLRLHLSWLPGWYIQAHLLQRGIHNQVYRLRIQNSGGMAPLGLLLTTLGLLLQQF